MRNTFPITVTLDKRLPIKASEIVKRFIDFTIQYKLVHIVFWIWFTSELYHTRNAELGVSFWKDLPDLVSMVGTQMLAVYFTAYFLVPRYLDKRRYGRFLLLAIATIIGTTLLHTACLELYSYFTAGRFFSNYKIVTLSHLLDTAFNTPVLVAVITYSGRYRIEEKNKVLEREKTESELNFLRAQINPHFVFNALNSINVLIDIDKEKATEALTKFSSLLRYNLYETPDKTVLIQTEINYLKDYVEIERLRTGKLVAVNLNITPVQSHFRIAPFLLVSFIENAFKHVTRNKDQQNYISIFINTEDNFIDLIVENSADAPVYNTGRHNGIGLVNVRRRLELLYPGNYTLDVQQTNGKYLAKLRIYAKQNELPYS